MFRRDANLQDGQLAPMSIGSTIVPRANLGTYARATYIIHIGIKQPFWWWGEKGRKEERTWTTFLTAISKGKSGSVEESVNNRKRTRLFQICVYRYNNNIGLTSTLLPSKSNVVRVRQISPSKLKDSCPGDRRSIVRIDSSISRRKPSWSQRAASDILFFLAVARDRRVQLDISV